MKALVFAAGLGTRLKPITDSIPKALVEVGGKPLLHHVISKLKAAGFDEVVVNVYHFAQAVTDYIHGQDDFGIKIDISDESGFIRDTGGGMLYARDYLEGEPFLIHNVDILSNLDLGWFMSQARPDALSNILVSERETQRYFLFDDDMRLVGWMNTATKEVRTPFFNLNVSKCRKYAFGGIHYVTGNIFDIFDEDGWNSKFSITDFYVRECYARPIYGIVPEDLRLVDVGKPETLKTAGDFLGLA